MSDLLAAVRELCPSGLEWLERWLSECKFLKIKPGPEEIATQIARAKKLDVPLVRGFYCCRCAGFHRVELTHHQIVEFYCRRCCVWQTVTRYGEPKPLGPNWEEIALRDARAARRQENQRAAESTYRDADRAARLQIEAERRERYERDYALRPTTDSHDTTWMSNFSLGRDTDHLLALDSWNECLMYGMEHGYVGL